MQAQTKQFDMINVFRLIAAYLIIVIHTCAFQCFGEVAIFVTNFSICMIAIPFFFATSGYFLYSGFNKPNYMKNYVKKLSLIFLVATIIYAPLCLPGMYGDLATKGLKYIFQTVIIYSLPGHLWYISTLLMSALVIYVFLKKNWMKPLMILSVILFILTVIGQGYFNVFEGQLIMKCIDGYNVIFDRIRNGFAFGIPYMTMGVVINKYKLNEKVKRPYLILLIAIILYAIEGYLFYHFKTGYESYTYFSHALLIPIIFILLLNAKLSLSSKTSFMLRELALWIYIYHIVILRLLGRVTDWFKYDPTIDNYGRSDMSLIKFLVVCVIITPIAYMIGSIRLKRKEQVIKSSLSVQEQN